MPIVRNYKPGSIIYFEGDRGEDIYILQSGKVVLSSQAIDTGEEIKETIANGEFFGVKSVLGKYPREETAQVVAPSVVLVLTPNEFEKMVMGNFRILMKMLKVFSNQLRRIGKSVREILEKGEPRMPATELFYIGEYYFKKGKAEQAKYVYKKYIEHYPDGEFVAKSKERLDAIERGDFAYAQEPPSVESSIPQGPVAELGDTETEESVEPVSGETSAPAGKKVAEGIDIAKRYYEGLSLFSQDKVDEAMQIYKEILEIKRFKDEATAEFAEKAQFELGRSLMKLEKYNEAIENFSNLIKRFQRTKLLKDSLYNIGTCYEALENYQKAFNFYQKVINMPPKEAINSKAKASVEKIKNKL